MTFGMPQKMCPYVLYALLLLYCANIAVSRKAQLSVQRIDDERLNISWTLRNSTGGNARTANLVTLYAASATPVESFWRIVELSPEEMQRRFVVFQKTFLPDLPAKANGVAEEQQQPLSDASRRALTKYKFRLNAWNDASADGFDPNDNNDANTIAPTFLYTLSANET